MFLISCLRMGLGSWAGGAIHDAFGTYQLLFVASFAIGGAAVFTGIGLRPPIALPERAPAA